MTEGLIVVLVIGAIISQFSQEPPSDKPIGVSRAWRNYQKALKKDINTMSLDEAVKGNTKSEEYLKIFSKELALLYYNRITEDILKNGVSQVPLYIDEFNVDIEEELIELIGDVEYEILGNHPRARYIKVVKK